MSTSKDPLVEDYYTPPRGGYPDSASPQSKRGSAQDYEKFGSREVSMSDSPNQRVDPANPHAWSNVDSLHIEDENPR
jgi:hypothetical protein